MGDPGPERSQPGAGTRMGGRRTRLQRGFPGTGKGEATDGPYRFPGGSPSSFSNGKRPASNAAPEPVGRSGPEMNHQSCQ